MRFRTFSDNWNFWTVKYLRRVRHNFSLVICVGILLLLQFLIFRSYIGETKDKTIFDLYSGTGTIAQMMAPSRDCGPTRS